MARVTRVSGMPRASSGTAKKVRSFLQNASSSQSRAATDSAAVRANPGCGRGLIPAQFDAPTAIAGECGMGYQSRLAFSTRSSAG
jgi:hypothetical protein